MDKLYTCLQLSERYAVPVGTVWLWIRKKKLPAIRIGREYRVSEESLRQFENERKTV